MAHRKSELISALAGRVTGRPRGARPAGLRYVERDAVRTAVPDLGVAVLATPHAYTQGSVDVITWGAAGRRQLLRDLLQVLDLEPDMMDAAPFLSPLRACYLVILEMENCQVNRPVRE